MTAIVAGATMATAQVKVNMPAVQSSQNMDVALKAAPAVKAVSTDEVADAPMYNQSNGNYYHREWGTYYVNVTYTDQEQNEHSGLWLVTAPFTQLKFHNMAADKTKTAWMCWNRSAGRMVDFTPDENGDYVLTPSKGLNASAYYMPITRIADDASSDTFYLGRLIGNPDYCYVQAYDSIGGLNYSLTDNNVAYGYFSNFGAGVKGSFFGSNAGESSIGNCMKVYQYYPKPIAPMVVERIQFGGWTFNRANEEGTLKPFSDDGYLTVKLVRGQDPNGTDIIAEMKVNNDNLTANSGEWNATVEGSYNTVEAYQTEEDAFGNLNLKPIVIDDEFTLVVDGFDPEKADIGIGCTEQTNLYWEGARAATDPIRPSYAVYSSDPTKAYRIQSCNARFYFVGMFDVINIVSGEEVTAPVAGGRCTFTSDGSTYVGPQFQSTREWLPEGSRVANYQVEGLPDWLTVSQCIASNYNADAGWINILDLNAEALPSSETGRMAQFTITSEYGAKSQVVTVIQGDVTGITTIDNKAENTGNGAVYNLAGQRVNDSYTGVVIENGKKVIKK